MTESPVKWSFEELQLNYLNSSRSDAALKRTHENEMKQNTTVLMDSGITYYKSPLLSHCFLLKFFFMNSTLLRLFESNQNRTQK